MPAPERFGAREFFHHPLAGAVMRVVGGQGFEAATIEEICVEAGVERAEFDRLFDGKASAVLRTFEAYIEDFEIRAAEAYEEADAWPDKLRRVAYALIAWVDEHPFATKFGMVEMSDAGEMTRVRQEGVLRWCAQMVDDGRDAAPDREAVPENASLIVVGSIAQILTRQATDIEQVRSLVPELMYTAIRPYLGEEAAKRELAIAPPSAPGLADSAAGRETG
ncbi:MAG TPA: hypothetical protein VFJ65_01390 [Solirubrobacterales bacterium]|nr:hypothetical protein [Solirubrobacterales bacterium]